ncbi:MAG TPA: SUMF1/EgtB/PvdO family nonheme iron enzyme, partial [Polyangiaceae bacterium]
MGLRPSAGWKAPARIRRAGALAALLTGAVCACNALLGTPEPELAQDGGADGMLEAAAGDGTTQEAAMEEDTGALEAALGESATDGPGDAEGGGPPSCAGDGGPGVTTCGPTGDSCCTSLPVEGGTFARSYSTGPDGGGSALDAGATVSTFLLDEYEVTVGRFRQFVAATHAGWTPPPGSGIHTHVNNGRGLGQIVNGAPLYESGWVATWSTSMSQPDGGGVGYWDTTLEQCTTSTWTSAPGGQESLPLNCVNWYEAYAFCIWDGGFLPSSAEWEYAAAGGSQQREYPWGATDPGVASQFAIFGCEYPDGGGTEDATGTCNSTSNIAPVGSAPM